MFRCFVSLKGLCPVNQVAPPARIGRSDKRTSEKLHCNGHFPLTLTWPSWIWQPGDLDDPLRLFGFYDLCDLHHIRDHHDFYELIDYDFRPHYLPFLVIELLFYNARGLLFSISIKSARGRNVVSKRYYFPMESTQLPKRYSSYSLPKMKFSSISWYLFV